MGLVISICANETNMFKRKKVIHSLSGGRLKIRWAKKVKDHLNRK
jgi:hypothetical protein